jgi:hypothetical protein
MSHVNKGKKVHMDIFIPEERVPIHHSSGSWVGCSVEEKNAFSFQELSLSHPICNPPHILFILFSQQGQYITTFT